MVNMIMTALSVIAGIISVAKEVSKNMPQIIGLLTELVAIFKPHPEETKSVVISTPTRTAAIVVPPRTSGQKTLVQVKKDPVVKKPLPAQQKIEAPKDPHGGPAPRVTQRITQTEKTEQVPPPVKLDQVFEDQHLQNIRTLMDSDDFKRIRDGL